MTSTKSQPNESWLWLAIFLFHFAFFLSGYIQEDAFITFRTGFNLADHGVYSYNLDERYPGATSLLYGYYTAAVRTLAGGFAITVISLLNLVYSCVAGWLLAESIIATSLLRLERFGKAHQALLFVACTAPALLRASGSGMETPLLILNMALVIWSIQRQKMVVAVIFLALLPFIRIDAVAFGLISVAVVFLGHRRHGLALLGALITGVFLLLVANHASFGAYLPLTAEAKQAAYLPQHDVASLVGRLWKIFGGTSSYISGVSSKFIPGPIYVLISVTYILALVSLMRAALLDRPGGEAGGAWRANATLIILGSASILVPLAYVYGGVIFPWYLWPSSVMAMLVLSTWALRSGSTLLRHTLIWGVAMANLFNILIHLSIASQEAGYRASIGNYLRKVGNTSSTLFLEPAGYIPFFAGMKAYDTIGLASGRIMQYRQQSGQRWWIEFLRNEKPTFVLERHPVHLDAVMEPGIPMDAEEISWFRQHYRLTQKFSYKNYLDENTSTMTPLLRLGHHSDYYVYTLAQ